MAKETFSHVVDKKGKVHVVSDRKIPKGMRGVDPEYSVHTFKEGPLTRLFNRKR